MHYNKRRQFLTEDHTTGLTFSKFYTSYVFKKDFLYADEFSVHVMCYTFYV